MINSSGIAAVLATKQAMIVDLVTLTIKRGRCHQFDGSGVYTGTKEILDSVRWTSAPRELRANVYDAIAKTTGLQLFSPLSGVAYQRGTLKSAAGAEVLQLAMGVTGTLPIYLSTAQDGSGSFATTLGELALLGMLEGAWITIDQAVVQSLPDTPASAGPGYGIVSPDPVRVFGGVVRGVTPTDWGVEFDCCDPLIMGGGSVPRNLFSPVCRWEFTGPGCPIPKWGLTVKPHPGGDFTFGIGDVRIFGSATAWSMIVPQDGPMMGMQFQVGSLKGSSSFDPSSNLFDFADHLPWPWSCTVAHVEHQCSKRYLGATYGIPRDPPIDAAPGCGWHEDNYFASKGIKLGAPAAFGGAPDMPRPESA